jgi:hypothetical protein
MSRPNDGAATSPGAPERHGRRGRASAGWDGVKAELDFCEVRNADVAGDGLVVAVGVRVGGLDPVHIDGDDHLGDDLGVADIEGLASAIEADLTGPGEVHHEDGRAARPEARGGRSHHSGLAKAGCRRRRATQ